MSYTVHFPYPVLSSGTLDTGPNTAGKLEIRIACPLCPRYAQDEVARAGQLRSPG